MACVRRAPACASLKSLSLPLSHHHTRKGSAVQPPPDSTPPPALYFKIKTTHPKNFSIRPSDGFIGVGLLQRVKVTVKAPLESDAQPRFQIRATQCDAVNEAVGDLWKADGAWRVALGNRRTRHTTNTD